MLLLTQIRPGWISSWL